ncbi:MAG TPA: FAD-dependent oxidoreductase [Bryobacteraceae bacterium]
MNPKELLDLFTVPDDSMPDVYLLGCYARRVTLYSQQVRALNLIYALREEGKLVKDCEVAVIGGGAAGLTAAAAAAHFGARVTLIEKLQGAMELQRNNRQRWIHPFIYDWPETGNPGAQANLPVLDWEAGYAENVAMQIEEKWTALEQKHLIDAYWGIDAGNLQIWRYGSRNFINCTGFLREEKRQLNQGFHLLILAVGFGVEQEQGSKSSYWSEDNIDSGFQTHLDGQKWLISGCGDGGLTDVMRLCIHRFRHERIKSLFPRDIDTLSDLLLQEHKERLPTLSTEEEKEVFLSDLFAQVQKRYDLLPDFERKLKRQHKPEVYLTGTGPSPYGPDSSILNRLIISQLARHAAFSYIQGPSKIAGTNGVKQVVQFAPNGAKHAREMEFDRVIERHGPRRAVDEPCFEKFKEAFASVKKKWDGFQPADPTRERGWTSGYFGGNESLKPLAVREAEFAASVKRLGVRAEGLTIIKEVRSDGSSTLSYQFDRLSVLAGKLSKLHFVFSSSIGSAGGFKLDADADRLGLEWQPEEKSGSILTLKNTVERIRRLSGFIVFPNTVKAGSPSLTFGLSFRVLNGDALSKWEFAQMYSPKEQAHVNGESLRNELEYLARVIWFPVEKLRMKLTLPGRASTPPFLSAFLCNRANQIAKKEIFGENGVLEMAPLEACQWHPRRGKWLRTEDPLLGEAGMTKLVNSAPQTWELTVSKPAVGSCYSLDWVLHSPSPALDGLAEEAIQFRKRLLQHRHARLGKMKGNQAVLECFEKLKTEVYKLFTPEPGEQFEVSALTYDEGERALVFFEGTIDGEPLPETMWINGSLPFGIGLAGTCFKNGQILFHQRQARKVNEPKVYLPLPKSNSHEILVSLPLDHPEFSKSAHSSVAIDRSRQCIGVVNVGSRSRNEKLAAAFSQGSAGGRLLDLCREFCSVLYDKLVN